MTRKVRAKQIWRPPSASDHNAMAAAADSHRRGPDGIPPQADPTIGNYVTIRNDSGADRRQYEVLKIDSDFVLAKTSRDVWVNGIEPDGTGPYAILLQPIADEKFGLAQVSGICPALVDVSAITDTQADVVATEYTLTSGGTGPLEIVQQPGSTGEQLCIVRFSPRLAIWRSWKFTWSVSVGNTAATSYSASLSKGYAQHPLFPLSGSNLTCLKTGWYPVSCYFRKDTDTGAATAGAGYNFSGSPYGFRGDPLTGYPVGDANQSCLMSMTGVSSGSNQAMSTSSFQIAKWLAGDLVGIGVVTSAAPSGGWAGSAVLTIGQWLSD